MQVRTATPEDRATVVDTAARSLADEAMLRWSFGEDGFRERIRRHFDHYDGENVRRGWVRVAADGAGIAVGIPPGSREEHEAIGPALMRDGLAQADRLHVPSWLETSVAANSSYYERFGFRTVVDEDAPDGGPHIWFVRRDPD